MYNLLLSLALGIVVAAAVRLAGFPIWAGILPGLMAFVAAFILLARRVGKRINVLVTQVQRELSSLPANPRERAQKVDKAVKLLEQGLVYSRWQFLIASELHAQIGMIKYMVGDLEGARPHLERSNPRNYMANGLLAALRYRKKDYAGMEKSFEVAVKSGKKEPLIWAAYAWCQLQLKHKDKALAILARAVQVNPSDEKLKSSLAALQNDKRLKMKPYEPGWWQFGLEQPPSQTMGGRPVRFERR